MASRAVRRRMDESVYWQDAPEYKLIDVNASTTDVQPTGVWQLLNGVSTGTDYQLRVGRKIQVKSVSLRGCVSNGGLGIRTTAVGSVCGTGYAAQWISPDDDRVPRDGNGFYPSAISTIARFVVLAHMCGFMGASTNVPLAPGGEAVDVHCEVDLRPSSTVLEVP